MSNLLLPIMLGVVIVSTMTFAVFPVFSATAIHTSTSSNIDDQDQIVTFLIQDTKASGGDVFFTPSITDGWSGRVNLFFCDESANPSAFAVKADTNDDDTAETTVVSINPGGPGCFSDDAALPAGTDRIAFANTDDLPNTVVITLHLDSSPEL